MSDEMYEYNPVTRITAGAIGRPGHRIFVLQAEQAERRLNLKLEKEQLAALARGIDTLLEELEQNEIQVSPPEESAVPDLALQEPTVLDFIVGEIGLGFDRPTQMLVLVVQEVPMSEDQEPATARLWATPGQLRALSQHAKDVVSAGRPICPLCQQPIDPEGHFCPRRNGHARKEE